MVSQSSNDGGCNTFYLFDRFRGFGAEEHCEWESCLFFKCHESIVWDWRITSVAEQVPIDLCLVTFLVMIVCKVLCVLLNSLTAETNKQKKVRETSAFPVGFRGDGWRRPRCSGLLACCGVSRREEEVGGAALVQWSASAARCFLFVLFFQTRALKAKDKAAPSAKPSDRKKAMMAPAVSASCGATFLHADTHTHTGFSGGRERARYRCVTTLNYNHFRLNVKCLFYFFISF